MGNSRHTAGGHNLFIQPHDELGPMWGRMWGPTWGQFHSSCSFDVHVGH